MSMSRHLGLVLFSSVLILGVANIRFPFLNIMKGTRLMRGRPKVVENSEKGEFSASDDESSTPDGELITPDSSCFLRESWRRNVTKRPDGDSAISCELEIVNDLDECVLLCWVTDKGDLKHYRPLNDKSIQDKSVSNVHVEYTNVGDHFVCIRNVRNLPTNMRTIQPAAFVFSYTPRKAGLRHTITLTKGSSKRQKTSLRGGKEASSIAATLSCAPVVSAGEVIDSSAKVYESRKLCGFTVRYESGVFEEVDGFESAIAADIAQLTCLLPEGACTRLQQDTPIYINKSLTYGTTKAPVVARGCCYHPRGGADWLEKNGLNVCKEGCVEIFSASGYLQSRDHWGTGGVLVHEFSHVYHDKHCADGYDCVDIRNAYNTAMRAGLYDSVCVHGPQGIATDGSKITAKAYACTNCMEFFAELSVAYHYSLDAETEYNKWFPHNRHQLRAHDPDSYTVLDKIWQQYE